MTCAILLGSGLVLVPSAIGQDPEVSGTGVSECSIDLTQPGHMKDIVSNALLQGLHRPETEVAAFLEGAESRYSTGQEIVKAAAARFDLEEADLLAAVERFRHVNCSHGSDGAKGPGAGEVSKFAEDVIVHVVLHELAHALVREFDLPVLGNEETLADAFATYYLTTYLPDRAVDVLEARTVSLMIEAEEVPRGEWTVRGEHDSDARRAHQIAALAVAADPEKYRSVAAAVGMSDRDIRRSRDYGSEIHRSWRRVLRPLMMPDGLASGEVRVRHDTQCEIASQLHVRGVLEEIESATRRFDWHSQVTIHFAEGDGGAGWSRNGRTITVHSGYVRRFIRQGASRVKRP